ncbi:hypothetical protein MMC29_004293, partial [Sticta canariensis]|nr:hypothetical protein [Sticta canariensis]
MPIRWNSLTDQTVIITPMLCSSHDSLDINVTSRTERSLQLLLKILETSSVNVDVKAVAAAWPQDLEKPTPRAISERLVKIRGMAKSSGTAAHFSVSRGNKSNKSTPSPRKAAARRPAAKKTGGVKKAGAKRKGRGKDFDEYVLPFRFNTLNFPELRVLFIQEEMAISPGNEAGTDERFYSSDTDFASSKEETPEPDFIVLDVESKDEDETVASDVIRLDEEDDG